MKLTLLPLLFAASFVSVHAAIQWAPCDIDFGWLAPSIKGPLDCARLNVPLDYTNPNSSEELSLQLIKRNATKEPFLGSIIFNPGGPGGSGVEDLAFTGLAYNSIIGGQYDLVSFDPRGTGETIPFDCGIFNDTDAPASLISRGVVPNANLTEVLYSKLWDDCTFVANKCYETHNDIGSYLSTAFVARDIMQIVDALDQDGMLRYWGISYGTLLGATIAAMFPDRIERMFLDSVVNPLDYMAGYWLDSALDSDKALIGFFEECVAAGPSWCEIANFSGPSTNSLDLVQALDKSLQALLVDPVYVPEGATFFGWDDNPPRPLFEHLKSLLFSQLYSAVAWSGYFAPRVGDILRGDFSSFLTVYNDSTPMVEYNKGTNAYWGISCSDSTYRAQSPEDMLWLVEALQKTSGFADTLTSQWVCYQWNMSAAERYSGDFTANTSYPVLISNGIYDPITPYASAVNLSSLLAESVLLKHGGHGHSFLSQPSLCTARAVRAYFVNGTLPEPDTFCEPDVSTFEVDFLGIYDGNYTVEKRNEVFSPVADDEEEVEMLAAMYELAFHSWKKMQRSPTLLI